MSNLLSVLKSEIVRVSRKEIRTVIKPLQTSNTSLKKTIIELKKRIALLESQNKQLQPETGSQGTPQVATDNAETLRINSKTIRSLRTKLNLSQGAFGKLLGVSSNAVYAMEHKDGRLNLRSATLSNLLALKSMGKREIRKKILELA